MTDHVNAVLFGLIIIAAAFCVIAAYNKWRTFDDASWRATTPTKCELCERNEAILTNRSVNLEVCEDCDELLP